MSEIGKSIKRIGVEDRVCGAIKFAADLKFSNVLHVKLVRLPVSHARILNIDTTAAYQIEGVKYVLTDKDFPQPIPRFGPFINDQPIIATGE